MIETNYNDLTKYISIFEDNLKGYSLNEVSSEDLNSRVILDDENELNSKLSSFVQDFYKFLETHPQFKLNDYRKVLSSCGVKLDEEGVMRADVKSFDALCTLALILLIIRSDRFSEGTLLHYCKNGKISQWLSRLQEV